MWPVDDVQSIEVIERGPVRASLKIARKFSDSTIVQKVYVYNDISRIDFNNYVDWKEHQVLLKAAFPIDINTNKATYEIQYGNVERPTHNNTSWDVARFEVVGQKWADLSEGDFGVSLLNDSKYGHDIKDGLMRLTLIKSGIEPNLTTDQEEHFFTYSLYPHSGDWKEANTVQMAYNLNSSLCAVVENAHAGKLANELSILKVDKDNVIIEVVKKAEDSDDLVVRLYECHNKRSRVNMTVFDELNSVIECNLMERDVQPVEFDKDNFSFEINPYEIKTFKLRVK
jgi:alpha-mannosidase